MKDSCEVFGFFCLFSFFREFGPLKRFCAIAVEMFTHLLVAEGRSPLFRLYIGICESKGFGLCNLFGPNCESAQDSRTLWFEMR